MCLCFDDAPLPDDPKAFRPNKFQISMWDALTHNQPTCLLTYFLPCCCAYYTRYRVLDSDMTRYTCCQGYLDNQCCKSGCLGEHNCPEVCLATETICCLGPSISSSRMFIMDQYDLRPDPCDNQIVRFTNCLMMLSCICDILAIFDRNLQQLANILHLIANCVFYSTVGCMASQVNNEIDYRRKAIDDYSDIVNGNIIPYGSDAAALSDPILREARVIEANDKKYDQY